MEMCEDDEGRNYLKTSSYSPSNIYYRITDRVRKL